MPYTQIHILIYMRRKNAGPRYKNLEKQSNNSNSSIDSAEI